MMRRSTKGWALAGAASFTLVGAVTALAQRQAEPLAAVDGAAHAIAPPQAVVATSGVRPAKAPVAFVQDLRDGSIKVEAQTEGFDVVTGTDKDGWTCVAVTPRDPRIARSIGLDGTNDLGSQVGCFPADVDMPHVYSFGGPSGQSGIAYASSGSVNVTAKGGRQTRANARVVEFRTPACTPVAIATDGGMPMVLPASATPSDRC